MLYAQCQILSGSFILCLVCGCSSTASDDSRDAAGSYGGFNADAYFAPDGATGADTNQNDVTDASSDGEVADSFVDVTEDITSDVVVDVVSEVRPEAESDMYVEQGPDANQPACHVVSTHQIPEMGYYLELAASPQAYVLAMPPAGNGTLSYYVFSPDGSTSGVKTLYMTTGGGGLDFLTGGPMGFMASFSPPPSLATLSADGTVTQIKENVDRYSRGFVGENSGVVAYGVFYNTAPGQTIPHVAYKYAFMSKSGEIGNSVSVWDELGQSFRIRGVAVVDQFLGLLVEAYLWDDNYATKARKHSVFVIHDAYGTLPDVTLDYGFSKPDELRGFSFSSLFIEQGKFLVYRQYMDNAFIPKFQLDEIVPDGNFMATRDLPNNMLDLSFGRAYNGFVAAIYDPINLSVALLRLNQDGSVRDRTDVINSVFMDVQVENSPVRTAFLDEKHYAVAACVNVDGGCQGWISFVTCD